MGTRRRLTKKQLKQDKFVTTTFEMAQFLQDHMRKAIICLVASAIVLAGGLYYWNYKSHKDSRAVKILNDGRVAFDAGNYLLAITDLEKFRNEFLGTKYGDEAIFILADSYFQTGNYEVARSILDQFIDRYAGSSHLAYKAYLMLGCTLENLESYGEAAVAYMQASERARFDYQEGRARIDAARAYSLAGNQVSALEEYRYVLDNYPGEQMSEEVAVMMAEVEANVESGAE